MCVAERMESAYACALGGREELHILGRFVAYCSGVDRDIGGRTKPACELGAVVWIRFKTMDCPAERVEILGRRSDMGTNVQQDMCAAASRG